MNIRKALVGAMLVVGAAGIAGAAQAERAYIDVQIAPPPDRVEHMPPPRTGYVWAPGYWRWDRGHHVWVRGHYIRERPGHQWVSHRWVHRGDRWRFEEGHWD